MGGLTVKFEGISRIKVALQNQLKSLTSEMAFEIQDSMNNMANGAIADAPVDQGLLKAQITVKKIDELTYELISPNFYSPYIEFGTKTYVQVPAGLEEVATKFRGRAPEGGGGIDELFLAIIDWVRRKGISGTYSVKTKRRTGSRSKKLAEDYDVAYPIVRAILKKGIKPQPFFFKQLGIERPKLLTRLQKLIDNKK